MIYPSTHELLRLLGSSVVFGGCSCLAYDLLRITRMFAGTVSVSPSRLSLPLPRKIHLRFSRSPGWSALLINLGDIFFFLLCGVALSVYFSAANHGRVRWIALAGLSGGFLLCRKTLSVLVLRCAGLAVEVLRFLLAWAFWLVCRPVCLLWYACQKAGGLLGKAVMCLWLPFYTRWRMRYCLAQLRQFNHQKRRMHNGTA